MFRKVHRQLSLLCAGITIFILLIMSFLYLYVSEAGLKKSQFLSFQRDMSTFIANFEQQTVITHEWLSKIENNSSYLIFVIDNGIPFQFNTRSNDYSRQQLMNEAFDYCNSLYRSPQTSAFGSYHYEFDFSSSNNERYYGCLGVIPHENKNTQVLVLSSLENQALQIKEQRIRFLIINIISIFLLSSFSWFFTKKLLSPIEKNRQEQIQFFSSASHELRTPLAVILSCAEACKKASPEEEKGFLSAIRSEGYRMSRLIDDMLLLSKADSHNFDIHLETVEADTLLLNSFEAFEPMAKEKNLSLQIQLPETAVPPCLIDGTRFNQVIAILLHNAISYTPSGGKIILSLSCRLDTLSISVIDNGVGISDEEKENIFRRFYRADKSRNTKGHFGLGLCIAVEIITAFKGTIHVTDTEGGGTTFLITIPMQHPVSS